MKKNCILPLLLTAVLLTGCAQTQTHTHTAGEWRCDLDEHWQLCAECGEVLNKAPHAVADELCSGCGAEVYFYEDENATEIFLCNSHGDWSYSAVYGADGAILQESRAEYGYDENGLHTFMRHYEDGAMVYECLYTVNALGNHVPTEDTTIRDGVTTRSTFNEYGDWTLITTTEADGTVSTTNRAEYTYDAEGNRLTYYGYTNDVLDAEVLYAFTPDGEHFAISESYAFEDGSRQVTLCDSMGYTLEHSTYTPDGALEYGSFFTYHADHSGYVETYYEGEMLMSEYTYVMTDEDWMTNLRAVNYDYDGSCSVYEYDIHGNDTLEAYYDAAGTLLSETRYENEYDAEGNRTLCRTYVDGRLTEETEYRFGSDGDGSSWSQSGNSTTYHEDGSKTVYTYAEDNSWAEEATYDAAGTLTDTVRYEYDYNEDGESTGSRTYHNGTLTEEVQAVTEENDEGVRLLWTYYEADGSKTVQKYGDGFEYIGETVYDAAGNILSES